MTQISPPIARAVSVLNFLAEHAEQAFTLSEIAKSLRISSATCHSLLTALTDAGYLYRTAGKTYVLGPALARISQAALAPAVTMQVTRPEMRLLADEFDVVCSAVFQVGDKIVVKERASAVSHLDWHRDPQPSFQATAQLGGMFVSGGDVMLRRRGFSFAVRTVPLVDAEQARALQNRTDLTDYSQSSLEPQELYQLASILAPVFAAPGVVAFGLSLTGFDKPVRGAAVQEMGERLRGACDRIGAFIAGRKLG